MTRPPPTIFERIMLPTHRFAARPRGVDVTTPLPTHRFAARPRGVDVTTLPPPRAPAAQQRRRKATAAVVVAALVLGGVAAATALTVQQRTEAAALYAERVTIGTDLTIRPSTITPAADAAAATGTAAAPAELAASPSVAATAIVQDHWVYEVQLDEAGPAAVAAGSFEARLQANGVTVGSVFFGQASPDAAVVESVILRFDLGTALSDSSLYYLTVASAETATVVARTVQSVDVDGAPRWQGVGAPIDATINPTLTIALGESLSVTAINADDLFHDIGFLADGSVIDPPGWSPDIGSSGAQTTLAWTPSTTGTYEYRCRYHPDTMVGQITVV